MNKIRAVVLILIITLGLMGIILFGLSFSSWPFVYWWLFTSVIFLVWSFKVDSEFVLWVSFLIFFLSALLFLVGLKGMAETFMRISFLGWMIGLIKSLTEYKNLKLK